MITFIKNILETLGKTLGKFCPKIDIQIHKENNKTLRARKEAHRVFDQLWMLRYMSRNLAYTWLASKLNIKKRDCHISLFDEVTCQKVIQLSKEKLIGLEYGV